MRALATKYRPTTFDDVVGQENIVKILMNQVLLDSIKQAYLFTGGAGTGKTTTARILANSIDADVLEIDGASNNGVDNIREIREQVKFRPIKNKYKVVIIDEVHMLSTGAFNALLKIIEEPPSHVVFIFATTDPQKIPATVLSRVQRFDFKRLNHKLVVNRLKYIIEQESHLIPFDVVEPEEDSLPEAFETSQAYTISVSDDALDYIAKLSQGGMRSAISILDTCLGYDTQLDLEKVVNILGTTDYDVFFSLASAIIQESGEKIITIIEEQHEEGKDMKQFVKSFLEFIVDVMKAELTKTMDWTSIPFMYEERVFKMLKHVEHSTMKEWFTKISKLHIEIRYETSPKTLIVGEFLCL